MILFTSAKAILVQYKSGDGNDTIYGFNESDTLTITGGSYSTQESGSDVIVTVDDGKILLKGAKGKSLNINKTAKKTKLITLTDDNDKFGTFLAAMSILGGAGNDSIDIHSSCNKVTIDAGDGNDSITHYWSDNVTIYGGAGNDYVYICYGEEIKIDGGDGNDRIHNGGRTDGSSWNNPCSYVTINAGNGNDAVYNEGDDVTINAGAGDDYIYLGSRRSKDYSQNIITYADGDGHDTIYGLYESDTLKIACDSYSTAKSGNDVLVTVGKGSILLVGAASLSAVKIKKTKKTASKLITLTEGNDTYNNSVKGATIQAFGGKDEIWNDGLNISINGDAGNDEIWNGTSGGGDKSTINGGTGNDLIINGGSNVLINAGSGSDSIENWRKRGFNVTINGGAGNDLIRNNVENVTINGGTGNDTIELDYDYDNGHSYDGCSKYNLIIYKNGDGNDSIKNFNETSTLSISGGSYSTTKSGKNIIVTVDDGKITLIGAGSLSKVNIKGTEEQSEKNSWKLNGTTATYGTSSKILVTVKGVKSLDGLSINKKVVTVSKASLGTSKVTISDGYTLKLASDVKAPTTKNSWSLNKTTATYNQTKSAGYSLASDSKSISYSKKSSATLATVKGVKSLDGLSVNKKVVTISKASLGTNKVTISDGYTLKLGSDVDKPTTKKAAWTLKNSTATYKSSYKTDGYTLTNNAITYSKATTAKTLATVKGVKNLNGLSVKNKVITLKNSALNKKVTVSGSYEFDFASG